MLRCRCSATSVRAAKSDITRGRRRTPRTDFRDPFLLELVTSYLPPMYELAMKRLRKDRWTDTPRPDSWARVAVRYRFQKRRSPRL